MKQNQLSKCIAIGSALAAALSYSSMSSAAAVITASYNLGTPSAAGATNEPAGPCQGGADALRFTGSGSNNIGIHTYSCDYYGTNGATTSFGSRSSGENTYYVDGSVVVTDTFNGSAFTYHVSAGEVGAFGSTLFGAGEFQRAELAVRMTLDGALILDQSWFALVGVGGTVEFASNANPLASDSIGYTFNASAAYVSFDIFDLYRTIGGLSAGSHTVSYSITSKAFGNVNAGSAAANNCFAPAYYTNPVGGGGGGVPGGGEGEPNLQFALALAEEGGGTIPVSCGAGARSGDPFNIEPGIVALAADNPVPLPAPLALAGLGLAVMGLRRRAA
jgi:hypothetical protein